MAPSCSRPTITAPLPFTEAAWKSADLGGIEHDERWRMIPSLVASHALIGMSRTDVETLLGPPTRDVWSPGWPYPGYTVRWIRINETLGDTRREPLLIGYDDENRVNGYWSSVASAGALEDL